MKCPHDYYREFADFTHIKRSELSITARNYIKLKERELGKNCGQIWMFINPVNDAYIFGRFNRTGKRDSTIVTIAHRNSIGWITTH